MSNPVTNIVAVIFEQFAVYTIQYPFFLTAPHPG
jgi:hypothetical protein